jgi:hypothetical protein
VGDLLSDGAGEVKSGLWAVGFVRGFSQIEALLYERREIASTCISGLINGIPGREEPNRQYVSTADAETTSLCRISMPAAANGRLQGAYVRDEPPANGMQNSIGIAGQERAGRSEVTRSQETRREGEREIASARVVR